VKADETWKKLRSINDINQIECQLDVVPEGLLTGIRKPGSKRVSYPRNIAPAVNDKFHELVKEIAAGYTITLAPVKTIQRCVQKRDKYLNELDSGSTRWVHFKQVFEEKMKRPIGDRKSDLEYAMNDFCRASVTASKPNEAIDIISRFANSNKVVIVGLKNGFSHSFKPPPSGYRDVKLIIRTRFDDIVIKNNWKIGSSIAKGEYRGPVEMIFEVQIVLKTWLECKKWTAMSYKVRRVQKFGLLCHDLAKYRKRKYFVDESGLETVEPA